MHVSSGGDLWGDVCHPLTLYICESIFMTARACTCDSVESVCLCVRKLVWSLFQTLITSLLEGILEIISNLHILQMGK